MFYRSLGKHYRIFVVKQELLSSITIISREGNLLYNWNHIDAKKELIPYTPKKQNESVRWDMPSPDPVALEVLKELK